MHQPSSINDKLAEEITFVELTALVKAELQKDQDSLCTAIAGKYGISQPTMSMLIKKIKSA